MRLKTFNLTLFGKIFIRAIYEWIALKSRLFRSFSLSTYSTANYAFIIVVSALTLPRRGEETIMMSIRRVIQ